MPFKINFHLQILFLFLGFYIYFFGESSIIKKFGEKKAYYCQIIKFKRLKTYDNVFKIYESIIDR